MLSSTEYEESGVDSPPQDRTSTPTRVDESDSDDLDGEPDTSSNIEVTMDYDIDFPPPKPGPEWTRFICISDTHGARFGVPPGDVLLHTGDLTRKGTVSELRSTMDWLASLRHPFKIVIAGNHDRALDPNKRAKPSRDLDHAAALNLMTSPQARASNIHYLNCESFQIPSIDGRKSWNLYGSPWTPWYHAYLASLPPGVVDHISPDADIVMTHGPPRGVLDLTRKEGVHAGCPTLLNRITELKPRLHVFGHIHESRGSRVQRWENIDKLPEPAADRPSQSTSTVFVNAANSPVASTFGPEANGIYGQRIPIGGPGWHPIIVDML
ncbi:hypothetical protein FRC04_008277 [Tulasnella sp. 424]|nr:hypothetical protein FRC04_008277 [Tulasnella sp. 424]